MFGKLSMNVISCDVFVILKPISLLFNLVITDDIFTGKRRQKVIRDNILIEFSCFWLEKIKYFFSLRNRNRFLNVSTIKCTNGRPLIQNCIRLYSLSVQRGGGLSMRGKLQYILRFPP
jgi:hypothetical protein